MQSWILAHKFFLILIILLDGLVLNYLGGRHKRNDGQKEPGLAYFWQLFRQGDLEGALACGLTAAALLAGLLLASTFL